MQQYQIRENEAGQRLDKYLKKLLNQAPGSFLYKMLRKKNIVLNEKKADGSEKLKSGDKVTLFLSQETIEKFQKPLDSEKLSAAKYPVTRLEILYESQDFLVINKPAGMLSQKAKPDDISANEYIIGYLLDTKAITEGELATFSPSVVNRLDRNTPGILAAGKTLKGLQQMSQMLKQRELGKYYGCLAVGEIRKEYTLRGWLQKDDKTNRVVITKEEKKGSVPICTVLRPQKGFDGFTLLEVQLVTGRSHQIRAHLASVGHPIVGDPKYGDLDINRRFRENCGIHSQLLYACRMELPDQTVVKAPLPKSFQRAMKEIQRKETV